MVRAARMRARSSPAFLWRTWSSELGTASRLPPRYVSEGLGSGSETSNLRFVCGAGREGGRLVKCQLLQRSHLEHRCSGRPSLSSVPPSLVLFAATSRRHIPAARPGQAPRVRSACGTSLTWFLEGCGSLGATGHVVWGSPRWHGSAKGAALGDFRNPRPGVGGSGGPCGSLSPPDSVASKEVKVTWPPLHR